jgi:hypothetical protein
MPVDPLLIFQPKAARQISGSAWPVGIMAGNPAWWGRKPKSQNFRYFSANRKILRFRMVWRIGDPEFDRMGTKQKQGFPKAILESPVLISVRNGPGRGTPGKITDISGEIYFEFIEEFLKSPYCEVILSHRSPGTGNLDDNKRYKGFFRRGIQFSTLKNRPEKESGLLDFNFLHRRGRRFSGSGTAGHPASKPD